LKEFQLIFYPLYHGSSLPLLLCGSRIACPVFRDLIDQSIAHLRERRPSPDRGQRSQVSKLLKLRVQYDD